MIKAKTHKAKSDKETIIDMEPVNETQKTIILKNPIFLIPFITGFLFIIILIWLTVYYLPNHIEEQSNKITQLNNIQPFKNSPSRESLKIWQTPAGLEKKSKRRLDIFSLCEPRRHNAHLRTIYGSRPQFTRIYQSE